MADYTVKLIITNESNKKQISYETILGEERTQELLDVYNETIGIVPCSNLDDIR